MTKLFTETHIDVARNSTDDFNLFHDKTNWHEIERNPFAGPIVLGFQLMGLIAESFRTFREDNREHDTIERNRLRFSYYQLKFAKPVKPGEAVSVSIKSSKTGNESISNRFSVTANSTLALIGYKKELTEPPLLPDADFTSFAPIERVEDRSFLDGERYFVKHKFLNTANGKNFLVGCLTEQSIYFDELKDRVCFPEVFPIALSSCALLERAHKLQHDFRRNPMVYVSHQHCIDREQVLRLKSNMRVSMLVQKTDALANGQETYHCFGLINGNNILYRSELCLAPLSMLLKSPAT